MKTFTITKGHETLHAFNDRLADFCSNNDVCAISAQTVMGGSTLVLNLVLLEDMPESLKGPVLLLQPVVLRFGEAEAAAASQARRPYEDHLADLMEKAVQAHLPEDGALLDHLPVVGGGDWLLLRCALGEAAADDDGGGDESAQASEKDE